MKQVVKKMNGVLKTTLKMCHERPKACERYSAAVLTAYRDVPQPSTGFRRKRGQKADRSDTERDMDTLRTTLVILHIYVLLCV